MHKTSTSLHLFSSMGKYLAIFHQRSARKKRKARHTPPQSVFIDWFIFPTKIHTHTHTPSLKIISFLKKDFVVNFSFAFVSLQLAFFLSCVNNLGLRGVLFTVWLRWSWNPIFLYQYWREKERSITRSYQFSIERVGPFFLSFFTAKRIVKKKG